MKGDVGMEKVSTVEDKTEKQLIRSQRELPISDGFIEIRVRYVRSSANECSSKPPDHEE
jgi:hypothetical protein